MYLKECRRIQALLSVYFFVFLAKAVPIVPPNVSRQIKAKGERNYWRGTGVSREVAVEPIG